MFGYDNVHSVVVALSDLTADGTVPIWRVPSRMTKIEVISAEALLDTAISGTGTTVVLQLVDMGTAGTTLGGTVCSALGGTATGDWTANTPRSFTVSEGTMDATDWLAVTYDETGTVAPLNMVIQIDYVSGVGA